MITGAHFLIYSKDPEADRAFFKDVLGFGSVDLGHGWLIFALPPSEIAVHPAEENFAHREGERLVAGAVVYLMCDDVHKEIASLKSKGVTCTALDEQRWGTRTTVPLPGGSALGLYQPKHPLAATAAK